MQVVEEYVDAWIFYVLEKPLGIPFIKLFKFIWCYVYKLIKAYVKYSFGVCFFKKVADGRIYEICFSDPPRSAECEYLLTVEPFKDLFENRILSA